MNETTTSQSADAPPRRGAGALGWARGAGRVLLELLTNRLEVLSTDLAEEGLRLTKVALVALFVVVLLEAGMFLALLFLLLLVAPAHRVAVIGSAAAVSLGGAIAGWLWIRATFRDRPPMAASLAQMQKDAELLGGGGTGAARQP